MKPPSALPHFQISVPLLFKAGRWQEWEWVPGGFVADLDACFFQEELFLLRAACDVQKSSLPPFPVGPPWPLRQLPLGCFRVRG